MPKPRPSPAKATPRRAKAKATTLLVDVRLSGADLRPPLRRWLARQVVGLATHAGLTAGILNICLVDDREMSLLHKRHTGIGGTTDVLTFDLRYPRNPREVGTPPSPPPDWVEADLVICLDEAARQARHRGHEARLEVLLYAVHGMLHLMGYDDHRPGERACMHRREDQLLRAVGIGRVYATDPKLLPMRRRSGRKRV